MEYQIEEVLYRDQRTFKTRIFEREREFEQSSLNCQYQYSTSKRLYQTDQCRFKVCDKKDRCWKKFYKLLLLSIYLSLLTLPRVSAQPSGRMDQSQETLKIESLKIAHRTTESASNMAINLQGLMNKKNGTDLGEELKTISYDWLPVVPRPDTPEFKQKMSKGLRQILLELFEDIKKIRKVLEVVENHRPDHKSEIIGCRNQLYNLMEELKVNIPANNLKLEDGEMPKEVPTQFDKTSTLTFDCLVSRSQAEVLVYAFNVFKHFQVPE